MSEPQTTSMNHVIDLYESYAVHKSASETEQEFLRFQRKQAIAILSKDNHCTLSHGLQDDRWPKGMHTSY